MKKKVIINIIIIFIFIATAIGIVSYKLFGESAKEINASKQFMSKLYSMNAVERKEELSDLKYERVKTINSQNELVSKSIVTQDYGIDLDKDNNVVGFAKKDITKKLPKITEENARVKAEEYLMGICGNDLIFVEKKDDSDLPYYSFIYTKKENGYKLYFDEIKINIDKQNAYIDGYSNTTMQKKCKEAKISISEEEAENIAYDYFAKYDLNGEVSEKIELVYADNKIDSNDSNELELCYIVPIKANNYDQSDILFKILVNADNGKVYSCIKENVTNKVVTN
ncbi:YcdB/YcdC domain-containing protein [uncultured Clostridium sp.]|uniref:YcdB/YcdC domain-containing protein n=1 Tax=uncultured Clostridium sp. TaxID=59620 RepID=UPI0025F5760D|nr:YcdB/YcdC domain-containing protein [uncultured Clostridium sp.]